MNEPWKYKDEWYVETPDGPSGPWNSRAAAEEAGKGNFMKANFLNNKVEKDAKRK